MKPLLNKHNNMHHKYYMQQALNLGRQALDKDEFPVGCVIVYQDRIIAQGVRTGSNQHICSELEHAEMAALSRLEQYSGSVKRSKAVLYTTMEPCLMCFGAMLISGIGTIVYAYEDAMGGGTACDRNQLPPLYRDNRVIIIPGICREQSLTMFKAFFNKPHLDYLRDSFLANYTLAQSLPNTV